MIISASEALNCSESSNCDLEAMPALIKSSSSDNWLLSSKRSAASASQADCFNMSLGAGPLWWS